jgi:hypothetical protein
VPVKKTRTLYEGPEWEGSRQAVDPDVKRFDEAFRFIAYNIAVAPRVNTTPFLSDNYRILVSPLSYYVDLWVYFRIEPDDESCTLLWLQTRKHDLGLRAG